MSSNYTDQLAEWVKHRQSTPRDKNVAAFLAVRDDIRTALDAGYPMSTVWKNLYESHRIEFRYNTFLNYVHRFVRQGPRPAPSPVRKLYAQPAQPPGSARATPGTAAIPGFTFNPLPRREDLL